jgi:glycosyltransferase involved in cell wall biosynthesis
MNVKKNSLSLLFLVPEKFELAPEYYGGALVRAYKIYKILRSKFLDYIIVTHPENVKFFPLVLIKAIISVLIRRPDIIISPWGQWISMLLAEVIGFIFRLPTIIVFNAFPIFGQIGYHTSFLSRTHKSMLGLGQIIRTTVCYKCSSKNVASCIFRGLAEGLLCYFTVFLAKNLRNIMSIAITPMLGEDLRSHGFRVAPVYPGNGVEIPHLDYFNAYKVYDACYVANPIHLEKGLIDVLYVWYRVVRKLSKAKLIIAGRLIDKKSERKLYELIARFRLEDNIILYVSDKGLSRNEVLKIMSQCRCFVYPSRKDVWPLVIGEALSIGSPVVAYALPSISYAYGRCPAVYLVKVGDLLFMTEKIIQILENKNYESISCIAKRCAEKITWKRAALLEAKAYLDALKQIYYYFSPIT